MKFKTTVSTVLLIVILIACVSCAESLPVREPPVSPEISSSPSAEDTQPQGYVSDEVDNSAREPYQFAFCYSRASSVGAIFGSAMKAFQDKLNITLFDSCSNGENDLFINNLGVFSGQGVDGFILNPDVNVLDRVCEVMEELEKPFVLAFNACLDEEGRNLYPCVNLFADELGIACMEWMLDNYERYIGKTDLKGDSVGYAFITYSTVPDLVKRTNAAIEVLKTRVGESVEYFVADCVTTAMTEEGAYTAMAPLLATNPDKQCWIMFADMMLFANGAARAVEETGLNDSTMITCGGETLLIQMWEEGYDGCWVGAYGFNNYLYVLPMLTGLIAMCDGRADFRTLWEDQKRGGDIAAIFSLPPVLYTIDNYKEILTDVEKEVGFEIAWY